MLGSLFHFKFENSISSHNNERTYFAQRIKTQLDIRMSFLFVNIKSNNVDNLAMIKSDLFDSDSSEGKDFLNMIEIICNWIYSNLESKVIFSYSDFILLLPNVSIINKYLIIFPLDN